MWSKTVALESDICKGRLITKKYDFSSINSENFNIFHKNEEPFSLTLCIFLIFLYFSEYKTSFF